MMNRKWNIRHSIQVSLLVICCSLIVGADSSPGRLITKLVKKSGQAGSTQTPPVVVAEGVKLEILSIKEVGRDTFEVVVRNGYKKDITGVAATGGDFQAFHRDYLPAEVEWAQKLAPGASDDFLYAPSRVSGVLPQIVISTVIFSDGTSEGDQREIEEIQDGRFGVKIQLNRFNPHLQRLGAVKASSIRRELEKLRSIAEALAIDSGDGSPMSSALESGLIHGRDHILERLSMLETLFGSNDRLQTFYQNGVPHTTRHTGEEDFRHRLPIVQKNLKQLADRL